MEESVIKLLQFSLKTGNRYLLKNITWDIQKGENWLLYGLNGCGKTTLLSAIVGYKTGQQGELQVFGEAYNRDNILSFRQKIAFVSSSFYDKLYTSEAILNIVLSGKQGLLGLDHFPLPEDIQKAYRLLEQFHLKGREDHSYQTLSKGERQSVLLARAMMNEAALYILDEPCSGLDLVAREHILDLIRELAKNPDITVLYVTHYADEMLTEFDHVALMRKGCLYKTGKSKDVLTKETMESFLQTDLQINWNPKHIEISLT